MNRRSVIAVAAMALVAAGVCSAQALTAREALDRYVASQRSDSPACTDSVFAVQIDASMPALKKRGSMSGFKWIVRPGQIVYRGVRITGDNLVKTQVIGRFLAHETNAPKQAEDVIVSPLNYNITFDRLADYNGLMAYVFLLRPRRKRAGLFRGEVWLDAETGAPLRLWGDLVKSPSIFISSFRFVQDYQTVHGCAEPLRLLLTARTRIAGAVEMTVWAHPASEQPEATGAIIAAPNFSMEIKPNNENDH